MFTAEPELYALVHKNLPVLRFPVNAVDAKLACVSSLVCLNQAWRQEWPSYTPLSRVGRVTKQHMSLENDHIKRRY